MTPRRLACGLLAGVLTCATPAVAQPPRPPATGGVLCVGECPAPSVDVTLPQFVSTLREAGYVDGQNVVIDLRGVGDTPAQLPALAKALVTRKVDVIVAMGASSRPAAS